MVTLSYGILFVFPQFTFPVPLSNASFLSPEPDTKSLETIEREGEEEDVEAETRVGSSSWGYLPSFPIPAIL